MTTLRKIYPLAFEMTHRALLLLNSVYERPEAIPNASLSDFNLITRFLAIEHNTTNGVDRNYIIDLCGATYQASVNLLCQVVKTREDKSEHFQRLLTDGISRLNYGDGYVKSNVFYPPLFRILAEMDRQERTMDDPRFKMVVEFINSHMQNPPILQINFSDLADFLCVAEKLKNIKPFHKAIPFCYERLHIESPQQLALVKNEYKKEKEEEYIFDASIIQRILALLISVRIEDYSRDTDYNQTEIKSILTDLFNLYGFHYQQGLETTQLEAVVRKYRVQRNYGLPRGHYYAADFLQEALDRPTHAAHIALLSEYRDKMDWGLYDLASELFRDAFVADVAKRLPDTASLEAALALVVSETTRPGTDAIAVTQQMLSTLFNEPTEKRLDNLEAVLKDKLLNPTSSQEASYAPRLGW